MVASLKFVGVWPAIEVSHNIWEGRSGASTWRYLATIDKHPEQVKRWNVFLELLVAWVRCSAKSWSSALPMGKHEKLINFPLIASGVFIYNLEDAGKHDACLSTVGNLPQKLIICTRNFFIKGLEKTFEPLCCTINCIQQIVDKPWGFLFSTIGLIQLHHFPYRTPKTWRLAACIRLLAQTLKLAEIGIDD